MIGIGKWEATASAMMMSLSGVIEIRDVGGQYDFVYNMPEKYKDIKINILSIEEVGNDTLVVKSEASAFPGKTVEIHATFSGDNLTGFIKVPIMGGMTVKIKNGHRIG